MTTSSTPHPIRYTVPGMELAAAEKVTGVLQERLNSLTDLHLTLKHIHWNVTGPQFIAVHEMLDPQVDAVRLMCDAIAERIATLGGVPVGTPGAIVNSRTWNDYSLGRATTQKHLGALDKVYTSVITDQRSAADATADLDMVSNDLLTSQAAELELFQWFIRAHLDTTD